MDMITSIIVLAAVFLAGVVLIRYMVDKRYPKIAIDITNAGVRGIGVYRLLGTTIVEDNVLYLFMNQFVICGDVSELEYDLVANRFMMFTTGYHRVYRGYKRFGYIFALLNKDRNLPDVIKQPNKIVIDKNAIDGKKVQFGFTKNGFITPFKYELTNEKLSEKEILNGKAICSRFVEAQRSNNQFNESTNPLITTLIYSIPLFIVLFGLGITIYLSFTGANDSSLLVVNSVNTLTAQTNTLMNLINQTIVQHAH